MQGLFRELGRDAEAWFRVCLFTHYVKRGHGSSNSGEVIFSEERLVGSVSAGRALSRNRL